VVGEGVGAGVVGGGGVGEGAVGVQGEAGTYSAGAFGFGERPEEAVGCDIEEGCDAARIRPTDLYCQDDRFLPFSRMSGAAKIFVVALVAFLVYGSVELTAQLDSAVPVNLGYILVGLGAIALPLRNFRRTWWVTAALWLAISGLALAFPLTDAHFHAVAAAAFLLVVMTGTTLVSMFYAGPLDEDAAGIASGLAVRLLLGAMGALAIGFASPLADWVWQAQGPAIGRVAFFAAAILAAGTLVTALVGGFVEARAERSDDPPVRQIGSPEKPAREPRRTKAPTARPARQGILDILGQVGDRLEVMLWNVKEVIRTVSIYVLRTVAYVIWKLVISLVNWVVKVLVLTWRYVAAGVKHTVRLGCNAVRDAVVALVWAAIFVLVPVSALAGAGLLVAISADETRRYIATGALSVLLQIIVVQFLALLLATVAWIMLASQRRRDSLASAQSSATITVPYLLLFVAAGGWLLGLPGTFGHGPIRVGFLTLTSTALIVVALVLRPWLNRMQARPPAQQFQSAAGQGHGGLPGWPAEEPER
jgi:hypothetical protein